MNAMNVIVIITLILTILNTILMFGLVLFIVRFRDRMNDIFSDIINALEISFGAIPSMNKQDSPKTWDEKYEEDLERLAQLRKQNSGLTDLTESGLSWGSPPAFNTANAKDLIIKDGQRNFLS